ncbi:MAG: DnaJ domain-containing protein [Nitrospirae bacterium]|nr:DnaJ domain-containing protein [Nitrospirota bacterium]
MDKDNIKQYFDILEIEPTDSIFKLEQTYNNLIKIWHPDRFNHDHDLQKKAIEKTNQINSAYELLCNYYINNDDLKKYYAILEINPTKSLNHIYQAFKELSKVWHPSNFSNDPFMQQRAAEKMKLINQSYNYLYEYFTNKEEPSNTKKITKSSLILAFQKKID